MAEFKLGRIKFVWQGAWTTGNTYVVDDVVSNGGQSYVCVKNHAASALFVTDLDNNPTYWNLVSGGTQWTGDWATDTYYNIGDQVKYGGTVYVATVAHTSAATTLLGLEADQAKWDAFAQSLSWQQEWTVNTRYRVSDFISYGGITYVCNTAHVSAATLADGLEVDIAKWDEFNQGIVYLSDWTGSVRYRINDVVKYGASTWICTTAHTSTGSFDDSKWDIFVEGLQFESTWAIGTTYQIGDTVIYGGNSYIAKQNHVGQNPVTATAYWDIYTTGFNFRSDWDNSTLYKVGDVVRVGGYTYLAIDDSTNALPPNPTYWAELNSGTNFRDIPQTYTAVTGTTAGAGINATFDIIREKTIYTVSVNNAGTGYAVNDTITILGTSIGGLTPANDLVLTVTAETSTVIDTVSVVGFSTSWTSGSYYNAGDLVFLGASTYICISAHTAAGGNRPDADTVAAYWNLFSAGAEVSVLTTEGDTYYFGTQGPTRLPIGKDGQLLRVKGGYPTWAYYGIINNLVYVAPTGTDSTTSGWGESVDKPWKTVRFAADQIRLGYQNRQAKELIEKNKIFMMREVSNWITYTYTVAITDSSAATNEFTCDDTTQLSANMPIEFTGVLGGVVIGTKYYVKTVIDATQFTISNTQGGTTKILTTTSGTMNGTLSYDNAMCERDTGYLVDAVAFDISHGGNGKSVTAAKAYYTPAGSAYINSNFGEQITQTVSAYTYLSTLMGNVLANVAPIANYQILNSDTNPASQIIDTTLTAEDGTVAQKTALITIITEGITSGTASSIPPASFPNTTMSVKTGSYYEILPIIVPNYTAVVGDELRGTVISPNRAIADLATDKTKTISSLNRIKEVIPNLLGNTTVVASSSNTETQAFKYSNFDSIIKDSVDTNIGIMNSIITGNAVPATVLTDPSDYDAGYFNARRLLVANKAFLQAEVSAWIDAEVLAGNAPFVGFDYSGTGRTKCERDVGYIVDAIAYDLTYGGNLQTIVAARAYYAQGVFLEPGEKTQALAVQLRIKDIIDNIVTGDTAGWSETPANAETQDVSGTAGSAGAGTFAQARIQEMYDTINTGTSPAEITPSTSWVNPRVVAAHTSLQTAKTTLRANVISWITSNYPSLVFNQTLCSRDIGYIIDALGYDAMFGSNFASIKSGMSYLRGIASTEVVLADQLLQTTGSLNYLNDLIKRTTQGSDTLTANVNEMTNILANGITTLPTLVYPDPVGIDSGYYHARRLLVANKTFVVAEISAWIYAQISGVVAPFDDGFAYGGNDQVKCERDVGYIVDALTFDLTYGGNLATVIAGRAYYTNGVYVGDAASKARALAVQLRIKDIVDNIVTGDTAGWSETPANAETQDVSGTAGSAGAGTFAQTRVQEIHDAIDTGTASTTIAPDITWASSELQSEYALIQSAKSHIQAAATAWVDTTYPLFVYNLTRCSRDVGYIVDALAYDLVLGSNFLSIQNAMSYYRALTSTSVVTTSQLSPTIGIIGFTGAAVREAAAGTTGLLGSPVSAIRINTATDALYAVLNNGLDAAPTELLTVPTGGSANGSDADYSNAIAQIAQNYAFIKADVTQYITNNYGGLVYDSAKCERDVGYILDAIRYDLMYGGNTQSLIAGSSYYTYINYVQPAGEKTATIAAYTHLQSIIDNIAQNVAYTPAAGNSEPRISTGTGDVTGTAAAFAQARVQDIIDWVTNGTAPTAIIPVITWTSAELQAGFAELQSRKAEIQSDGLVWVEKFYQDLTFNRATCSRDIGIMVDAIGYDMVFDSNFASIVSGNSYYRNLTSTGTVLSNQKGASLGLVNFLKYKIKSVAAGGGAALLQSRINDIINTIDGGKSPAGFLWPSFTGIDAENYAGAKLIYENKKFIAAEVLQYLNTNYASLVYSAKSCLRDVGLIVDALRYDLTYGGNVATRQAALAYYSQLTDALQIDAADKTATLAAYGQMKAAVNAIAQSGAYTALNGSISRITGTSGDATTASTTDALIQGMIDYIDDKVANPITETAPSTAWVAADLVAQHNLLQTNKTILKNQVTTYIAANYPNLVYNSVTCERDVGYMVDAIGYDLMFGSNFRSVRAGTSYYQNQASLVLTEQLRPTLQAVRYLEEQIIAILTTGVVGLVSARANMNFIIDIIEFGSGNTPEVTGSMAYMNNVGIIRASETLRANSAFLENEATAWIKDQFGGVVSVTTSSTFTTSAIHNLSANDPVEFSSVIINQYITEVATAGNLITLRSTTGMQPNMKFAMSATAIGNLGTSQIYYILTVENSTQVTVSETPGGAAVDPGIATALAAVTIGDVFGGIVAGTRYYVSTVPTDTTFTIKISKTATTDFAPTAQTAGYMKASYSFNEVSCRRDMREYVNALIHDLQFPGNHYSTYAALLYNNARLGSEKSDMFWVSNSTGLRNCTLRGLTGDLSSANQYGTKRPTAGAFVALNPGFGPNDQHSWVIARSHYSQNVTMFGSGCSGAKIDSALHAGGNKSMVKNDFTTIISDGIGVWCTGADSLTELVSVFNYYGYAGYIAEKGARIRATNGNSSYGTYGVIAEGVSSKEVPVYGYVDSRAAQAQITETITDTVDDILRMEFGNAGTGYTNVSYTINGSGYNAAAIGDEFRDASVFETRVIDLNDDNDVGGSSYETASNSAQGGDTTSITIAATDQALSAAYIGMRIQLTAGTGKGQFANIATYGTGSKIATVTKPSTGAAGWDHVIPGTPIEANLDLTTAYIIEPQITYSAPGYTATARTLATTADWDDVIYGDGRFVATEASGTVSNYSTDGITWADAGALSGNVAWVGSAYGGGFGATATAVVGGLGGAGAILTAVLGVPNTSGAATADQVASVTIVDGGQGYTTPPVIVFTPVSGGTGAVATCAVLDGKISSVTVTIPGTGYNAAPTASAATDRVTHIVVNNWGRNYYTTPTVTITGGGFSTQAEASATIINAGTSSITVDVVGEGYTSTPTVEILDTSARYVTVANGTGDNCYTTNAGIDATNAWIAGTATGKTDLQAITYGNGVYVAVGDASAISSTNGNLWLNRVIPTLSIGTYSDVKYGASQFVAIATGTVETAKSINGVTWTTAGDMPTSAAWGSIAYGNGRYVAIETGTASTKAAISYDRGTTWVAAVLPASTTWRKIAYGQGVFVCISDGTIAATSPDGIVWTQRVLPSSSNWRGAAFGNTSSIPVWSVVSGTNGTIAATLKTGATATGRVKVADGAINEVRMIEPGSSYPKGAVSATTVTTNLITVDNTINLADQQPVEFFGTSSGGLIEEQTYYVIGSTITSTQFKVASTVANAVAETAVALTTTTPSGMTYRAGPIITVTDPNNVNDSGLRVRLGDGALGNPSFTDRGTDNTTATTDVVGDGYSDLYQVSTFVNVYGLPSSPVPGSNVEFASIPGAYYKLVTVTSFVEDFDNPGTYTGTFQLNPGMTALLAPRHGDRITTRIGYSQVRLTGHDYLYIGTGNFEDTNYPNVDITKAKIANQELFSGGGRAFFTSTDQDGNFNVGDLFGVQQATGTATLNASAFNLSGLNSLQLGSVELGIGSAIITQFSTDPFFTADSDSVVPTQRAIRAYITSQIGGGQSSLNVNTLTSGIIYIAGNSISTTTGAGINVTSRMNFTGGIDGAPVALGYFLTR